MGIGADSVQEVVGSSRRCVGVLSGRKHANCGRKKPRARAGAEDSSATQAVDQASDWLAVVQGLQEARGGGGGGGGSSLRSPQGRLMDGYVCRVQINLLSTDLLSSLPNMHAYMCVFMLQCLLDAHGCLLSLISVS